jgi:hypothetical protein
MKKRSAAYACAKYRRCSTPHTEIAAGLLQSSLRDSAQNTSPHTAPKAAWSSTGSRTFGEL